MFLECPQIDLPLCLCICAPVIMSHYPLPSHDGRLTSHPKVFRHLVSLIPMLTGVLRNSGGTRSGQTVLFCLAQVRLHTLVRGITECFVTNPDFQFQSPRGRRVPSSIFRSMGT